MLVTAFMLVGCDDGGPAEEPSAVPAPGLSTFTQGDFDEIPVFRGATLVDGPTRRGLNMFASYETETATPLTVISWYEQRLRQDGWQVVEPVEKSSDGTWTGDWIKERRRLEVVAAAYDEPREGQPDDVTQTRFELALSADAGEPPATSAP